MRRLPRPLFVPLFALLCACSKGPSTAAGPLGEVDLTSQLPSGVKAPPNPTARDSTLSVCPGGKGDTPANLHVRWKTFTNGGASYVSWYALDLTEQVSGLLIALDGTPQISDANALAGGAPLTVVAITVKCTRKESDQVVVDEPSVLYVRGDGMSEVRK